MARMHNRGSRYLLAGALGACVVLSTSTAAAITEIGGYTVRCAYLIPSDRSAQTNAEEIYQDWMMLCHAWYADQMQRYGWGDPDLDYTFRLETEQDGVTPVVHFVYVSETRAELLDEEDNADSGKLWSAAYDAGVPVDSQEEIWVLVAHTHEMQPNGSVTGGVALGGSAAYLSGGSLAFDTSFLIDDTEYDGETHAPLGPYEMVQDVTWAWWQGTVFSQVIAVTVYGWSHELGHCFGLAHNHRNELGSNENLMGVGVGGFRGWLNPDIYDHNYMRLSYGSASSLSISPYFTDPPIESDDQDTPTVNVTTSGAVTPVNGLINFNFTAYDADGLAWARLYHDGALIQELELSGASFNGSISTEYYTPGESGDYQLEVADVDGNWEDSWDHNTTVTPATGYNRAPHPHFAIWPTTATVNETVDLDGSGTSDPDSSTLTYEWDIDNNGTYDIGPSYSNSTTTSYDTPGTYLIRLRVTDDSSGQAVSSPVLIVVEAVDAGETVFEDDFESNFDKWTDGGATNWDLTTSQQKTGSQSAHATLGDSYLTSDNIDMSGAESLTISFWYRDDDLDPNDIILRLYNGGSYVVVDDVDAASEDEDSWRYYTTTIDNEGAGAQYFVSNFRVQFMCAIMSTGENFWVDDIDVSAVSGEETLLDDDFENGNFDFWTDGGTTDWDLATDQYYSSSHSAHAGPSDNDLISDNLDASGASSITIDFWYRVDDVDDNDDVYLQLYNGGSYVNRYEIGTAAEDTWIHYQETISNSGGDAQYFVSNFRIKFEATSLDTGWGGGDENLWIDDVLITAE